MTDPDLPKNSDAEGFTSWDDAPAPVERFCGARHRSGYACALGPKHGGRHATTEGVEWPAYSTQQTPEADHG
jgi:hypothetical protein